MYIYSHITVLITLASKEFGIFMMKPLQNFTLKIEQFHVNFKSFFFFNLKMGTCDLNTQILLKRNEY